MHTIAAVGSGLTITLATNSAPPSPELLALQKRLLTTRAERDLLHQSAQDAALIRAANHMSDFSRALEAAESIVSDIEIAMVDFEPRSIIDLRMQVELALHQEVIDYGIDERLPQLICERFLRLIPKLR